MTYQQIVDNVSCELNLPRELVDKTYKAYWFFIKQYIQSLPLKEDLSKNNFSQLKTNINIPSLGKLTCTYDRMLNMKKRLEILNKIREKK